MIFDAMYRGQSENNGVSWAQHIPLPDALGQVKLSPGYLDFEKFSSKTIDGLVQDCSISSALAMEILQSCIKLSI